MDFLGGDVPAMSSTSCKLICIEKEKKKKKKQSPSEMVVINTLQVLILEKGAFHSDAENVFHITCV